MTNVAAALKSETVRIARNEIRAQTFALKTAVLRYRSVFAALKRRGQALERQLKDLSKVRVSSNTADSRPQNADRQLRFSAPRFAAQCKKLSLSAANMAKLLGVPALSIYKWESGQAHPRRAQLEAVASARGIGKRAALAKLEEQETA